MIDQNYLIVRVLFVALFSSNSSFGYILPKVLNHEANSNLKVIKTKSTEFELAIFGQCFPNETKPIVILSNSTNVPKHLLHHISTVSAYLLEIEKSHNSKYFEVRDKLYSTELVDATPLAATKFTIDTFDSIGLQLSLCKMKNTVWWNIYGFYLIKSIYTRDSCNFAQDVFETVWEFSILNAVFLCTGVQYEINFYTFNPFNTKIPQFWTNAASYTQQNGHPLTLYSYSLESNIPIPCEVLMSDKTVDLSIKLAKTTIPITFSNTHEKTVTRDALKFQKYQVLIIWKVLNANVSYDYYSPSNCGIIDKSGIANGVTQILKFTLLIRNVPNCFKKNKSLSVFVTSLL